jgi:hypothetical protein
MNAIQRREMERCVPSHSTSLLSPHACFILLLYSRLLHASFVRSPDPNNRLLAVTVVTPPASPSPIRHFFILGGLSLAAIIFGLLGCKSCANRAENSSGNALSKSLLEGEAARSSAAVASTKRAFGQINADGIIIPAHHLVFNKHIASGSFGRVMQGTITGTDMKVGAHSAMCYSADDIAHGAIVQTTVHALLQCRLQCTHYCSADYSAHIAAALV